MKTTIILEDEIHSLLVSLFGRKGVSEGVNKALFEHLVRERQLKSMFGADRKLELVSRSDIRDHHDRYY